MRRVFDVSGAVPAERRRMRWAPGGRGQAVESRSWNDSALLTADVQFLQDLDQPSRGLSQIGGGNWRTSDLALVAAADTGDWRRAVLGRRFNERDEVRAALGRAGTAPLTTTQVIGGLATHSGLQLPDAAIWATDMADEDVPTAEQARLRTGLPDPSFLDDEWGFLGANAPVTTPLSNVVPTEKCIQGLSFHRRNACANASVNEVQAPTRTEPCYATEPQCRGGGAVEADIGHGGGYSHPREPLRNADTHPLGVTLSNGDFLLTVNDLVLPGYGSDLTLSRTYRSQSYVVGVLGTGWTLSFIDERLWGAAGTRASWFWRMARRSPLLCPRPVRSGPSAASAASDESTLARQSGAPWTGQSGATRTRPAKTTATSTRD